MSGGSAARRRSPSVTPDATDEFPLRVLIADDHALYPKLLLRLFHDVAWIEVVGCAANGRDAVLLASGTKPDVVLMDLDMPLLDGIEATRLIKAQQDTTVLVLTASENADSRARLLEVGASAVLPKKIDPEQLLARLHKLHIDRALAALGFERVSAWEAQTRRRHAQTESSLPRHGDRSNQP